MTGDDGRTKQLVSAAATSCAAAALANGQSIAPTSTKCQRVMNSERRRHEDAMPEHKEREGRVAASTAAADEEEEVDKSGETCVAEGGWGWMVVLGAFFVYWLVPGMIRSYGAIHLEILETFPDSTESEAGWIPALLSSISVGLAPISAVLGKIYSGRNVVFVGGLFCALGLSLSYFVNSIFHLYITLGLISGIGAGLCTTPSVIVVNSYFVNKRALASGFCLSGAAVGSFTIPAFVKVLVDAYTFRGAMLVMGAVILHVSAASMFYTPHGRWRSSNKDAAAQCRNNAPHDLALLQHQKRPLIAIKKLHLRSWTPPPSTKSMAAAAANNNSSTMRGSSSLMARDGSHVFSSATSLGHSINDVSTASVYYEEVARDDGRPAAADGKRAFGATMRIGKRLFKFFSMCLDFKLFREVSYTVTVVTGVCIAGAFPHVLFYVPSFARTLGISKGDAGLLLSVCSAVDLVGRIAYGYFMDTRVIERSHGLAVSCLVCAVGTIFIPLSNSFLPLAACTALFGFGAGTAYMLLPVLLADNHGVEKLPSTYGLLRLFQGFITLVMPPVAGAIKDTTGHYESCFLLMGALVFAATTAMLFMPSARRYDATAKRDAAGARDLGPVT